LNSFFLSEKTLKKSSISNQIIKQKADRGLLSALLFILIS